MEPRHADAGARGARWPVTLLGALLLVGGVAKLATFPGYVAALERFEAFPSWLVPVVGMCWAAVEIAAGAGLLAAGLLRTPPSLTSLLAAVAALAVTAGYLLLGALAYFRDLPAHDCTYFGALAPLEPSMLSLGLDAVLVAWAASEVVRTRAWLEAATTRPPVRVQGHPA